MLTRAATAGIMARMGKPRVATDGIAESRTALRKWKRKNDQGRLPFQNQLLIESAT